MRTALDQNTFFYQLLDASALKTAINGGIYKDEKPANSKKEDVVINTVTLGTGTLQRGVSNINIYVPKLSNGLPNHARFNALVAIAATILEEGYAEKQNYWTEYSSLVQDQASGEWYYNFRLRTNYLNTKQIYQP